MFSDKYNPVITTNIPSDYDVIMLTTVLALLVTIFIGKAPQCRPKREDSRIAEQCKRVERRCKDEAMRP